MPSNARPTRNWLFTSPFLDTHGMDGLPRAADTVAFGFSAKAANHPGRASPINQGLTRAPRWRIVLPHPGSEL